MRKNSTRRGDEAISQVWCIIKVLKVIGLVALSIVFGIFGFVLLYSDLGPGESLVGRLLMTALAFLVAGVIIGYLDRATWLLAGLTGWGGVLLAMQNTLNRGSHPMWTLVLLLVSPGAAFLGGYLGRLLGSKWPLSGFIRGLRRPHR